MKAQEKKAILMLIIMSILIVAIIYLVTMPKTKKQVEDANIQNEEFVKVLGDGKKLNVSKKFNETKNINGLEIGNIEFTEKDGQCTLIAEIINNTSKNSDVFSIDIILYDEKGKEIVTIPGVVSPVQAGQTAQLNAGVTDDYANAYDFKIVKK